MIQMNTILEVSQNDAGNVVIFRDVTGSAWNLTLFSQVTKAEIRLYTTDYNTPALLMNVQPIFATATNIDDLVFPVSLLLADGVYNVEYIVEITRNNTAVMYKFYTFAFPINTLVTLYNAKVIDVGRIFYTYERHNPKVQNYLDAVFDCALMMESLEIAIKNNDVASFNLTYSRLLDTLNYLQF